MNTNHENIVQLVDEDDIPVGTMSKMQAHKEAALHRAVSLIVFNRKGEWLLQQRAKDKYHSAGLWSNACCTHPYVGEDENSAVYRRFNQELGITLDCEIEHIHSFIYKAKLNNELTEYEYDHLFVGITDKLPKPDKNEVMNWKYISSEDLKEDLKLHPEHYTEWFKIILDKIF